MTFLRTESWLRDELVETLSSFGDRFGNLQTHGGYAESACVGQLVCDLTDKAGGALVRGFTLYASLPLGS